MSLVVESDATTKVNITIYGQRLDTTSLVYETDGKNKLEINNKDDDKKKTRKFKGRMFLITQNDVTKSPATIRYLKGLKAFRFLVGCREVAPKTHHIHDHFFTQFKDSIPISVSGCNNAHIDRPNGTAEDCIAYIYKLKEPWKRGLVYTKIGEPSFFNNGIKVKDVIGLTSEEVKELPLPLYPAAEKVMRKFASTIKGSELKKKVDIYYFWGETHTLKSKYAIGLIRFLKGDNCELLNGINGFLNGMEGLSPTALYDEFRDTDLKLKVFLQLIDYNVQVMNIKGNYIKNTYTTIIFTSAQNPVTLYKNEEGCESRGQWLRRMHIYHFGYDKEKQKYFHVRQDFGFDNEFRPCPTLSEIAEVQNCHNDGSLLTNEEEEQYNLLKTKKDAEDIVAKITKGYEELERT